MDEYQKGLVLDVESVPIMTRNNPRKREKKEKLL